MIRPSLADAGRAGWDTARRAVGTAGDWWFGPVSTSNVVLFRVAFGAIMVTWSLSLLPSWSDFFGPSGLLPDAHDRLWQDNDWSVLFVTGDFITLWVFPTALVLASAALLAGYRSRLAAILVWICLVSMFRRNPYVFNGGDGLLRIMSLFVMLAPVGACVSIDAWRKRRLSMAEPTRMPAWPLRLMQLQFSAVYLFAVWDKVRTPEWNDGTAMSYALSTGDVGRLPLPGFIYAYPLSAALLTYGTLAAELALAIGLWSARYRRLVIPIGIALHLGIDYAIRVGFFSYTMIACYLLFISPARADRWSLWLGRRALILRAACLSRLGRPPRLTAPPERVHG